MLSILWILVLDSSPWLAKPAHQKALEKSLRIKGQSCPMLRLWPQVVCRFEGNRTKSCNMIVLCGHPLSERAPQGTAPFAVFECA